MNITGRLLILTISLFHWHLSRLLLLFSRFFDSRPFCKRDIQYATNYQLQQYPVQLKYNNVYMRKAEKMDHEIRSTYTGEGVQLYIEYRNQGG